MFLKKISFILSLLVCFVGSIAAEDYRSGEIRLEHIMLNRETGMGMHKYINPEPADIDPEPADIDRNPKKLMTLLNDLCYRKLIKAIPCKTVVGPIYLEEMLKVPYRRKDKAALLHKQDFIRTLVENPALKNKIDELLADAQRYEQDVIILMSDVFKNERCPELAQLELLKKEESFQYPMKKYFNIDPIGRTLSTPVSLFTTVLQAKGGQWGLNNAFKYAAEAYNATDILDSTGEIIEELAEVRGRKIVDCLGQFGVGSWASVTAFFGVYNLYRDYINAAEKRLKIHALNKLIQIAQELEALCEEHGISNQFKVSKIEDPKGIALLKDLQHERYQSGEDTTFFMVPLVHTLTYTLYKNDKQLAPVLACIAEIDSYNALATNILESYEKKNKFCFVSFIESDRPCINGKSFWSLLVKNAVSNSLYEDKHVLLTGSNAGGKSTTIRAILQNILLGQCFGVAAAQEWECTMFDVIHSYLNISDDPEAGESRFKAELERAKSIFRKIESLNPDQKYFFALDELFTGTDVIQGQICAFAFMKHLVEFQNVQCIYATHFQKLKEMGNDAQSGVVNYKVDKPVVESNGKLIYPFTISKGASPVGINTGLDLANQVLGPEFLRAGGHAVAA